MKKTVLQNMTLPELHGGLCVSVKDDFLRLSLWNETTQIDIQLDDRELFNLKFFVEQMIDARMSADKSMPAAYVVSGRRKP